MSSHGSAPALQKQSAAPAEAATELYETQLGWIPSATHQRTGMRAVARKIAPIGRRQAGW